MYNKLKQMRHKSNMTLQEVANKVGISKAFYCQLENGKRRMLYETAIKIAKVFNVKPDYIFYEETTKNIKGNIN